MKESTGFLGKLSIVSIYKYRLVYLGMLMITILGFYIYSLLPRESKPEIVFPTIKITANYPGASPRDVELQVTNKLESALLGLADLEFISSISYAGKSEIQLDFYPESDLETNYETVSQAVDSVNSDLPAEVDAPLIRVSTTANRAFFVMSLSGDVSPEQLREASALLELRIPAIEGVKEIRISGLYDKEIQISYTPVLLAEYGLTSDNILQAIKLNHKDTPAGDAELDGMQYYVRVLGAFSSVEDISHIQIPLPGGGTRLLKDLARVDLVPASAETVSRRAIDLGTPGARMMPSITISLYRDGGTDIVGPSREILELLEEISDSPVMKNLDLQIIQNDAVTVQQDLADVLENAFSGLLIVILVLYLFLGLREALITSLIIPFSMFLSFIAMHIAGLTFNTMTLLAMIIALGLLVDNGIVIIESIVDFRLQGLSRLDAVKNGAVVVAPSIAAATFTTMAAFIPLALMEGRIGMVISVIPITVIFIIGSSLLVALTLTPAVSARWLKTERKNSSNEKAFSLKREISTGIIIAALFSLAFFTKGKPGLLSLIMLAGMLLFMGLRIFFKYKKTDSFENLANAYKKLLSVLLSNRVYRVLLPAVMFGLLTLVFAGIGTGFLKIELFPIKDETALYALISAPEYSTLANTDRITREVEQKLLGIDGISTLYSETGLTSPRDAQVVMNLMPKEEREWTTQEKIPELMKILSSISGARITVGVMAGGKTANSPLQIKVRGEALEDLKTASDMVASTLAGVEGVRGVTSDWERGYPEIQILPKRIHAAASGVDVTKIGEQVRLFLGDQEAGILINKDGEQDIILSVPGNLRNSAEDLNKILIPLKNGEFIPITHVADLIPTQGYGTIRHSQGIRTVTVMAQMLPDANIREIVQSFDNAQSQAKKLPDGTDYIWAGDAADLDDSFSKMMFNFIAALVVVFFILVIQFNSFSQSLIILLTIPMSIIGVFTGLIISGNNFGLYAFMGVIALIGIVVNDAIVLVDTTRRLLNKGLDLFQALVEAGRSRFAPVLATSLTTIGGMLPLAFKDENFAQLSISLISGLIASTLLTLLILPLTYYSVTKMKSGIQKKIPVFTDIQEDK